MFLNKGLTCATFNWSGKMDVSIDLLIKDVIGLVTTGFGSLIIFAEMPSKPVAFFIFNLFICLSTKVGVTGLNAGVKKSPSPTPGASNFHVWAS